MAILHDSISPEARLPEHRFHDLLTTGNYQVFAYAEAEDVQGVALVYFSDQLPFAWLDYFAIRADLRSRGLGSKLFRDIVQITGRLNPAPDWLLFEVDDDFEGDPQREADGKRRLQFYRRLGARLLANVPYKFPSAFIEPIRMRLMAFQLRLNTELTADDLKQVVREVFLSIHGQRSEDNLLRWFEQNLPPTVEIR